jgi:hypothetical protein
MSTENSNIESVAAWLDDLVASFGFEVSGVAGKSLGDDAVAAVAESISEDARESIAPDGTPWEPNAEKYAAWKAKKHGVHDPGYLTGETLSIKALIGEVEVANDRVTMTHGTGAVDESGASDRDKGRWLTDGDSSRNRPERPFYALNDARNDAVAAIMADGLGRHLQEKASGGI